MSKVSPIPAWKPVGLSGGGGTEAHALSPHDPDLMFLQCDMSGAYRTEDGGKTWSLLPWQQLTGCPFCAPLFHPRNPRIIYAAYSYAATLRVSRDGGRTFEPRGRGLPGNLRLLAADPDQPARLFAATLTALYVSDDDGRSWSRVRGFTGLALGLHVDRSSPASARVCTAMTADTCFISKDSGASWDAAWKGAGIAAFAGASLPGKPAVLSAWQIQKGPEGTQATKGTLLRSKDNGSTWEALAELGDGTTDGQGFHALLTTDSAPRTLYAVRPFYAAEGTVMKSADGGKSWKPVTFADKTASTFNIQMNYVTRYFLPKSLWGWAITGAAINPSQPNQVLFSHYCSVFQTRNGGKSWASVETSPAKPAKGATPECWPGNGLVNTTTWQYAQDPFDPAVRLIAYTDLGLARSGDAGASWSWLRETGPNTYQIAFDPAVPGRAWAAFSQVHDIPNNNIVTGGHKCTGQGTVGFSEDHGRTWRGLASGLPGGDPDALYDWSLPGRAECPVTSIVIDPASPPEKRTLFASCWEHGVFRSPDGGASWKNASDGLGAPGVNLRVCRIVLHPDGTLFVVITGKKGADGRLRRDGVGLYRSTDGARSWEPITRGLNVRWMTDYAVDPRDSGVIYLGVCDDPDRGAKEGGLYKTEDGGRNWKRISRKSALHFGATLDPVNPDRVFMTLTYNETHCAPLLVSRNAGRTWSDVPGYPFCSAHRVDFDLADPAILYVTTYGAGVWTARFTG
jgi:photosystem II stability/assembly factor-like uncharacterized protein